MHLYYLAFFQTFHNLLKRKLVKDYFDHIHEDQYLLLNDPTKATINDIAENPKHLEIIELEAPQLPRSLDDVDISVINAGYAKSANLDTKTALATEDNTSPYVNIIAAREQDKDNPTYKKFVKIFQSEDVKNYINDNFSDGLVPAF